MTVGGESAMGKLVVLTLGEGDFHQGFPVTLQVGEEGEMPSTQRTGHLPPNPAIIESYTNWKSIYDGYMGVNSRLEKPAAQITNFSVADVIAVSQKLIIAMNEWLRSPQFRQIWETLLTSLDPSAPIRLVIQTLDIQIKRLPWNQWDFLVRYLHVEITIGKPYYNTIQPQKKSKPKNNKVNILAILGNNDNIDINQDQIAIQKIKGADPHFLVKPNRQDLNDQLWDKPWDILFFAGHSNTEGEKGRIYINDTESLTISELKYALRRAISSGLQLALFNSCDGLGLAQELSDLDIPQIIVMRDPVADRVAQEFLKYFLNAFSEGQPFYLAVREARERLQALETQFPCASWLPVIYQHPAVMPPTWKELCGIDSSPQSIEVFFSYADEDEDLLNEIEKHLSSLKKQGKIKPWSVRQLSPGAEPEREIDKHLNSARAIVLLISQYFLDSHDCYSVQLTRAMERYEKGEAIVIPVILRSVDWRNEAFGKLRPLPERGKPVTSWANRDEAFENIARGIRAVIESLTKS